MEEAEQRITTAIDTSAVAARKREALAAHASQLDQSWCVHFPTTPSSRCSPRSPSSAAEDRTGAPVPEDDLFAGLR